MSTKELNRRLLRVAAVLAAIPSARTSKFVNLLTPKDKQKYVDQCWTLLQEAYKGIGGFQSSVSPEHLIEDSHLWKLNVKGDKIVALVVYKAKFGRKGIGYATDGTSVGKTALKEIMHEDLTRAWVECSGPIEHMLLKMGGAKYIVPAEYASKLTGKECIPSEDGNHYTRQIASHNHEKIIIGTPEGIVIKRDV